MYVYVARIQYSIYYLMDVGKWEGDSDDTHTPHLHSVLKK